MCLFSYPNPRRHIRQPISTSRFRRRDAQGRGWHNRPCPTSMHHQPGPSSGCLQASPAGLPCTVLHIVHWAVPFYVWQARDISASTNAVHLMRCKWNCSLNLRLQRKQCLKIDIFRRGSGELPKHLFQDGVTLTITFEDILSSWERQNNSRA